MKITEDFFLEISSSPVIDLFLEDTAMEIVDYGKKDYRLEYLKNADLKKAKSRKPFPILEELYELFFLRNRNITVFDINRAADDFIHTMFPLWKALPFRNPWRLIWIYCHWEFYKVMWCKRSKEWIGVESEDAFKLLLKNFTQEDWLSI